MQTRHKTKSNPINGKPLINSIHYSVIKNNFICRFFEKNASSRFFTDLPPSIEPHRHRAAIDMRKEVKKERRLMRKEKPSENGL